jgi:UDP-N-acetylenolpyruvoylglucosamine reductase
MILIMFRLEFNITYNRCCIKSNGEARVADAGSNVDYVMNISFQAKISGIELVYYIPLG